VTESLCADQGGRPTSKRSAALKRRLSAAIDLQAMSAGSYFEMFNIPVATAALHNRIERPVEITDDVANDGA